jgi:hypothetical protein
MDKEIFITAFDGRKARVYMKNVDPLPVTVSAVIPRLSDGKM